MPRPHPLTSRRAFLLGGALLIATLSCGREVTGPDGARFANHIAFRALFAGGDLANAVASDLVPYTKVRVVLARGAGRPAFDEVVAFPAGSEELRINAHIPLSDDSPASGELMDLTLQYINAANDTVFRGGPTPVTVREVRDGEVPSTPTDVPIDYTGPGSEANEVSISPVTLTVVSGEPFTFTASATVDGQVPVEDAPIAWRSLDPALAVVTAPGAGAGTTLAGRGTARIVAQLLDGQADTVLLTVTPRAQSLVIVSGNNQPGLPGVTLPAPVVVRVNATDGQPMQGLLVTFAAGNGGSVGISNVVTDADGLAQATWTLGSPFGAQTLTVSSVGLTGSPLTFTAQTPATVLLHHYPIEGSLEDAAGTEDGATFGQHDLGNRVFGLDGASGYAEFASHVVPTSGSYSVSLFVRLNAAIETGAAYISQGTTGAPDFYMGHGATGQLSVSEQWPLTGVAAFDADGLFHHVVLVVDAESSQSHLYVDGMHRATHPAAIHSGAGGSPTRLGRLYDPSGGDYLNGAIDEVRIYGGALSAAQVSGIWTNGPSARDRLVFAAQPTNAGMGATIAPAVTVRREDAVGRLQSGFTGSVSVALGANPGAGALGGTTSVQAVGGVASFSTLSIDAPASGYTLIASTAGLDPAESMPFDIIDTGTGSDAVEWTNPLGGNWSVASNWSTGLVPGAADSVVIRLDGSYTVTLDVNASVHALTIGGGTGTRTLAMVAPRVLAVATSLAILPNAGLDVDGGTINGTGALVNDGTLNFRGGTIALPVTNQALLLARDASSLTGLLTTTSTSTLRVLGASVDGNATLTVANTFTNNGAIELTTFDAGYTVTLAVTNGWLENNYGATITSMPGAGGARNLNVRLVNRGTLTTAAALTINRASSSHENAGGGVIDVTTGNLTVTQSGTSPSLVNTGTINLAAGRMMSVSGGALNLLPGVLEGPDATLSTNGTTLLFNTTSGHTRFSLTNTTVLDAVTIPAGDSLRLVAGALNAPVINEGLLLVQGAVTLGGAITTGEGSMLRVRGSAAYGNATLTVTDGFTNTAAIELTTIDAGYTVVMAVTNGTLTNAPEGIISAVVGAAGARTLAAQIDNQGTLDLLAALTLARPSSAHVNSGTIAVTGGNLVVTQTGTTPSFANTGTITLATGRLMSVTGGALDLTGGEVNGGLARLSTNGTTLTFTTPEARTLLTLTTTTVPGTFTVPAGDSLVLAGGSPTFTLVNEGLLIAQDALTLNGTLTTAPGSTLRVRGLTAYGNATLTMPAGFTNSAAVELTTLDAGYSVALNVTGGPLVNTATGTIAALVGAAGPRTIGAEVINQGLISLPSALTIARVDAAHANSGTIDISGGNLTVTQTGASPSFANTGTITMANGRVMSVTGGVLDLTGGELNGGLATLSTNGTTLTFTTPEARTRLTLANTTVPGTFTIPAGDSLVLAGGSPTFTLVNEGLLLAQDALTLNGSITTAVGSTLRVRGLGAYGNATLTLPGGFTNSAALDLTTLDGGYSVTLNVTGGPLVNTSTGTITASTGAAGPRTIGAEVVNQGLISLPNALTIARIDAAHANSGTIDISGGNLTVTQTGASPSFANTGTITMANGRVMSVTGGALDLTGGQLDGGLATLSTNGTTMTFTTPEARTRLTLVNTTVPGTFTIPVGDSLVLAAGSPTFTLVNNGTLITQAATTLNGSLTTGVNSTLRVRGSQPYGNATLSLPNGFTNSANVDLTTLDAGYAVVLNVAGGPLVNTPSGVIIASVGAAGPRTLGAEVINQGLIATPNALTIARADAAHVNSGTINVTGGNLTVTQTGSAPSFSNPGTITMTDGRTMSVSGGALDLTGGELNGGLATLSTNGTTMTFTTPEARTRLTLANTTVPGTFTIPVGDSLVLAAGSPTFTLVNNGTLITQAATTLNGSLTTGVNSTLRVRGSQPYGNATLSLPNGFTNSANVDLTTLDAGYAVALNVAGGPLVNTPSGVIIASVGAAGPRTLGAEVINQGVIATPNALTIARADAAHVNSGTINVTGGNLTVTQTGVAPSFSNPGAITMTNGRVMSVTGGSLDLTGGQLDGGLATLSTNGTTMTFTTPEARTRLTLTNTTVPGTFTIPVGDSLVLAGGSPTFTLVNNGTLIAQDAITLNGSLTTGTGSTLLVRGTAVYGNVALTLPTGLTNTANVVMTTLDAGYAVTLAAPAGTLVNAPSGIITAATGATGPRTIAAQLDNRGIIDLPNALTLARASAQHVNSGSINVTGGNFTVTQTGTAPSFSNQPGGAIHLAAARTMAVNGGTLDLTNGLLEGTTATLSTVGTTLSFTPATADTRLALASTTVPHTVTIPGGQTLRLIGGALNSEIVNNGTLLVQNSVGLGGALTNAPGALLQVLGANGNSALTVTNGFTNAGTLELVTQNAGYQVTMNVTTGALMNASTGVINVAAGNGGPRSFTGALIDNLGTINAGLAWSANTSIAQRNAMNVTAGTTTVSGASTFHDGSVTTLTGTGALVKAGTCSNLGGTGNGSVCP